MTSYRYWLLEFDDSFKSKVKFVNNNTILAEGKCKVMMKRRKMEPVYVIDVLYVPSMKNNLLSLCQLLENNFGMNMKHNPLQVLDSAKKLILKALLSENITFKVSLKALKVL